MTNSNSSVNSVFAAKKTIDRNSAGTPLPARMGRTAKARSPEGRGIYYPDKIHKMLNVAKRATEHWKRDINELAESQGSVHALEEFISNTFYKTKKSLIEGSEDSDLVDGLRKISPKYGYIFEDGTVIPGYDKSHNWIIVPISGILNMYHGIPYSATVIALEENGEIVASLIYNPFTDDAYWAMKDEGSNLKRRIRVSGRHTLDTSLFASQSPVEEDDQFHKDVTNKLKGNIKGLRSTGCPALDVAYVASGLFDCYWSRKMSYAMMRAGSLIVREAGGMCTDFSMNIHTPVVNQEKVTILDFNGVVMANPNIHKLFFDLIKDIKK